MQLFRAPGDGQRGLDGTVPSAIFNRATKRVRKIVVVRRGGLPLATSFLEELARTNGCPPVQLTSGAEAALLAYRWPGNVRELRNAIERASIVCEGPVIDTEHLSLAGSEEMPRLGSTDLAVLDRQAIAQALRHVGGNKARAARQVGISRTQLYSRLRKSGLQSA